jgi:hypothetical protein
MQKNTSINLSKRLLQYGVLSAAALGAVDASGQIVYTDVTPDEVLNLGDEFIVDFTGAGTEFAVRNATGLTNGNAALVFPSSGGAFVGLSSSSFQYPNLLANGDAIDATSGYTSTGIRGDLNYYGCAYSNSQWCGDVNDGYLGVSFTFNGNTHYGWIRLDTDVNGDDLITVKDFAFNSTPDEAINAGQTSLGIDEFSSNPVKIVALNKSISLSNLSQATEYSVMDISGKTIMNGTTNGNSYVIDANAISNGIYIIELSDSNSNSVIRKKIVL